VQQWTRIGAALAVAVCVTIACQRERREAASPVGANGDAGRVTAMASPSPVFPSSNPIPTNPSAAPLPTNPSAAPLPTAPSPGPVQTSPVPGPPLPGPNPSTGPGGPPPLPQPPGGGGTPGGGGSPPGGGGGGGGAPGTCPAELRLTLDPTPVDIEEPGDRFALTPPATLAADCVIESVFVAMRVTAASLSAATAERRMSVTLRYARQDASEDVLLIGTGQNQPLSGDEMGTDCGNGRIAFRDGGESFTGAREPYADIFKPFGSVPPAAGSGDFSALTGLPVRDSRWALIFEGIDTDMVLRCLEVRLRLDRLEPPPLQPGN
jgi:hypothetical protein